jgi:hypothetical protein
MLKPPCKKLAYVGSTILGSPTKCTECQRKPDYYYRTDETASDGYFCKSCYERYRTNKHFHKFEPLEKSVTIANNSWFDALPDEVEG